MNLLVSSKSLKNFSNLYSFSFLWRPHGTHTQKVDVTLYLDWKQHRLSQHQHGNAPFEEGMLGDIVHLGPETSVFWEADTEWELLHRRKPTPPPGSNSGHCVHKKQLWFPELPQCMNGCRQYRIPSCRWHSWAAQMLSGNPAVNDSHV